MTDKPAAPAEGLREAAQGVVDSGPSHDAAYWGLTDHPTIAGADCQQMAWARDVLRAALAAPSKTLSKEPTDD